MCFNRNELGLCWVWFYASVENYPHSKLPMPSIKFPDYHQWAQEADAYAKRLLSSLSGDAKEEIEILLSAFPDGIRAVKRLAQGIRGYSIDDVEVAERLMDETIHDLQTDYGIEDTKSLENIQQELATWLHERRMEQHPGQAHSPSPSR